MAMAFCFLPVNIRILRYSRNARGEDPLRLMGLLVVQRTTKGIAERRGKEERPLIGMEKVQASCQCITCCFLGPLKMDDRKPAFFSGPSFCGPLGEVRKEIERWRHSPGVSIG